MTAKIERERLVRRNNPKVNALDPYSALTVGNGEFAFTTDITGLQTFPEPYQKDFPLCTASHWGWHSRPMPPGVDPAEFRYTPFDTHGRPVGYATSSEGQKPLFDWLRENPHRLHLGRIGLEIHRENGSLATAGDLKAIDQTLDLWTGVIHSKFEVDGAPVSVSTCCHPEIDMIVVRIESPLVAQKRISILLAFPYGSPAVDMADWSSPTSHKTEVERRTPRRIDFHRTLDSTTYSVAFAMAGAAPLSMTDRGAHEFLISGGDGPAMEFVCRFAQTTTPGRDDLPSFTETEKASAAHWERFWTEGGAVDLGHSTDSRAPELERRIVLSQYQTAINCAGSLPSAETGLLCNSWYGKFHLEMHWWHSVHFASWNRFPMFRKTLEYYKRILPVARDIARREGYSGARWPKMVGPDGKDSPSPVGPLLIWQQPHPIYYAELCYRKAPTHETLREWRDVVFETATFMASYAFWEEGNKRYILGPPLKTVSENQEPKTTTNPTFELAYWRFGLRVAQQWRERMGLARDPDWDRVLTHLALLPTKDGLYLIQEDAPDTYTHWNWEHPALVGAYGVQPGDGVDHDTMRATVRRVMETWEWDRTWGWDFPMTALAAARVGEPELAIEALMIKSPKNHYHPNGHVYQRPSLTAYLPANGGLLSAIALMAAGWTHGPARHAPGFPEDGKWAVKAEGVSTFL